MFAPLFVLFLTGAAMPARAQYPLDSDVSSPDSIVSAVYAAIQRAPGEQYQWNRFRSLFLPEATLIPNVEQTDGTLNVLSPEDFIDLVDSVTAIGGADDQGFAEEAIHNEVHRYGDVAHVFSTYQKRFWDDAEILGRGINAIQLVRNEDRWWIASIAWDEEIGAGPIPEEFLPE